jgi:hypothetical protein
VFAPAHPRWQNVIGERFNISAGANVHLRRYNDMKMPNAVPMRFQNANPIRVTLGDDIGV